MDDDVKSAANAMNVRASGGSGVSVSCVSSFFSSLCRFSPLVPASFLLTQPQDRGADLDFGAPVPCETGYEAREEVGY
jgi:hypothetical protein